MKKAITIFLVLLMAFYSTCGAMAQGINKRALMKLKPLPTERLSRMADESRTAKIFPTLLLSALGLAIIGANSDMNVSPSISNPEDERDFHRFNQLYGGMLLVTGLTLFFMPTIQETNQKTIDDMKVLPDDREVAAYYEMKSMAEQSKVARNFSGILYMLWGAGSLAYANNFEVDSMKNAASATGVLCLTFGLLFYFLPWPIENEVQQMDNEIRISVPLPEAKKENPK